MDTKVGQFLSKLPEGKRGPAMSLREIILSASKEVTEKTQWTTRRSGGCLIYKYGKDNISFIYTFPGTDYISLGFFFATVLQDPNHLFQGTGARMRHIKLRSTKDIPGAPVKAWVKEAVKLLKE